MNEVSGTILQHQPTPGYLDHASDQPDAFAVLCQRHVIINNNLTVSKTSSLYSPEGKATEEAFDTFEVYASFRTQSGYKQQCKLQYRFRLCYLNVHRAVWGHGEKCIKRLHS